MKAIIQGIMIAVLMVGCFQKSPPIIEVKETPKVIEKEIVNPVFIINYMKIGRIAGIYSKNIGDVSGIVIYLYEIINLSSNEKKYYLRITTLQTSMLHMPYEDLESYTEEKESGILDYEEIDSFLEGIAKIIAIDDSLKHLKYHEYIYTTKNNISITISENNGRKNLSITCGEISKSTAYLKLGQLEDFLKIIIDGKKQIENLRM